MRGIIWLLFRILMASRPHLKRKLCIKTFRLIYPVIFDKFLTLLLICELMLLFLFTISTFRNVTMNMSAGLLCCLNIQHDCPFYTFHLCRDLAYFVFPYSMTTKMRDLRLNINPLYGFQIPLNSFVGLPYILMFGLGIESLAKQKLTKLPPSSLSLYWKYF